MQFEGQHTTSPVDGAPFKYFAPRDRMIANLITAVSEFGWVVIFALV